jgi:cation-transporting ATPase 13A3/4/5
MCGDGANDCAALNQANLGLSLSDTEASIAAAFTAKQRHIGSMIELVKESRAGLATNFSLFNIMASYGLTQYSSSLINQYFFSYPSEGQFIYWDIILNILFVFLLGNIGTAPRLSPERPSASLLSISNLVKLFSYFFFAIIAQVVALLAVNGPFADEVDYNRFGG